VTESFHKLANLIDIQRDLEAEMHTRGVDNYRSMVKKAVEQGRESATLYGITLMKHTVDSVSKGIQEFVLDSLQGSAGRYATSARLLALVDPEVSSYVGLKYVMDGLSTRSPLTKTAMGIAAAIEDDFKFNYFKSANPELYFKIYKDSMGKTSNRHYRRYNIMRGMTKRGLVEYEPWTKQEKLHLGCKILDIIVAKTGLVKTVTHVYGRNKRQLYIIPTEKTLDWIEQVNGTGEILSPVYMPCVVPPRQWTDVYEGGYWFDQVKPFPMVKSHNHAYLEELESMEMPEEYRAINALQNTAFRVNKGIYSVMRQAWDSGESWGSMPPRESLAIPPSPFSEDKRKEDMTEAELLQFTQWKQKAARVYQVNAKMDSKRLQLVRTLGMAEKFLEFDEFYYVYQNDFRGRKYVNVSFLSTQGPDYSKALLEFAHGMPLGDEGAFWLGIQGANTFGNDKWKLQDRYKWAEDNSDWIVACADDPFSNRQWCDADDPWQFLAFCLEWKGYKTNGKNHISHIAVALDGSNNGLQHLSALARDSRGGQATNLIPMEEPQDIYQDVADVINAELQKRTDDPMARDWLEFGVNRKCCKRPVMVVPYGGKLYSCRGYIEQYIHDRIDAGDECPFEDIFGASQYLSLIMWDAISQVVVSARVVMDWLQGIGSSISKKNIPIFWESPSGFPVHQQYPSTSGRRITTQIDGVLIKPQVREQDFSKIDTRRSVNGVSPNFIHSLDAAAMTKTVNKCSDKGIVDFAMVHDSYGTHAANTGKMFQILREAFVEMYTENDPLEQFREYAKEILPDVPDLPPRGDLDIQGVLKSDFFFA
jgi:DNA-directed RNA polymerase